MSAATWSTSRASRASTGPRRRTAMASFVRTPPGCPPPASVHQAAKAGSAGGEAPLEAVEDEVEPELELGGEVEAGRRDVPGDHLEGVRVRVGHGPAHLPRRHLRAALGRVERRRQGALLQREAVD